MGDACGPAMGNWRCVLCGGCLWESGLKDLCALVGLLLAAEQVHQRRSSALQVLGQFQPGALGAMLVVELKTEKGAEKKYVIKQVRGWLPGKQESVGTFVISMGPSDSNRDKHVGQLGHWVRAGLHLTVLLFWKSEYSDQFTRILRLKVGKWEQPI